MRSLIRSALETIQVVDDVQAVCIDPIDDAVFQICVHPGAVEIVKNGDLLHDFIIESDQILISAHLLLSESICLSFSKGDIYLYSLIEGHLELAGSIEGGLSAVSWAPDQEVAVFITGDGKLLVMTRDFQVLCENAVDSTDFGEEKQVNLGWGSLDTQFKGSVGKFAGRQTTVEDLNEVLPVQDDGQPRIAWKGDGAHFAVSSLAATSTSAYPRRIIRFYSRLGVHLSTAEASPGLEANLAWQPSGSIIASTMLSSSLATQELQRDVIFFERNGLRRYEFPLRSLQNGVNVKKLAWNADSTLLAVWSNHPDGSSLELWTRNNYHWYLKQHLSCTAAMIDFFWHPEQPLSVYLVTPQAIQHYAFTWTVLRSSRQDDAGLVAVVDGHNLLITPFRYQMVPPPMSSYQISSPSCALEVPIHLSFVSEANIMAVLYTDHVDVWEWKDRTDQKPVHVCAVPLDKNQGQAQQIACSFKAGNLTLYVAYVSFKGLASLCMRNSRLDKVTDTSQWTVVPIPSLPTHLCISDEAIIFQDRVSKVTHSVGIDDLLKPRDDLEIPDLCCFLQQTIVDEQTLLIGQTANGKLYANFKLLSCECTSFDLCGSFLVFTTASHSAKFVRLDQLALALSNDSTPEIVTDEMSRRVERGSKLVASIASSMQLVLQMPRGNLETISPRPLVLEVVQNLTKAHKYKEAFTSCRKHRIDLAIMVGQDEEAFAADVDEFVRQITDPEHLNLFITSLRPPPLSLERTVATDKKVQEAQRRKEQRCDSICRLLRESLLQLKPRNRYTSSLLTTYACQHPPDLKSALILVSSLRTSPEEAEDAITYLVFLSDADSLFEVALSLYDFPLVLLVAQHSDKDPKEYLPFLRELKSLSPNLQHHRINDHLRDYDKALSDLVIEGQSQYAAVDRYVSLHKLFRHAIDLHVNQPLRLQQMHALHANHLASEDKWSQAALYYHLSGDLPAAIHAYSIGLDWQQAIALALSATADGQPVMEHAQVIELAEDLAERLQAVNRFSEAARLLYDYAQDVEGAVKSFCNDSNYAEAMRIIYTATRLELIQSIVEPAVLDATETLTDNLGDIQSQIAKQVDRIAALDGIRIDDPEAYFGNPDISGLDGVELDDSASTVAGTNFTRYTARMSVTTAGSQLTSISGKTSKSRRKEARKRSTGEKKGTIWEEDYLLGSLLRMSEQRLPQLQKETADLLPLILTICASPENIKQAQNLQTALAETESRLKEAVRAVWSEDSHRSSTEQAKIDTSGLVKLPRFAKNDWRLDMLG